MRLISFSNGWFVVALIGSIIGPLRMFGRKNERRRHTYLMIPIVFVNVRCDTFCRISFQMAEYDLTAKLGRYFDRHLVFPLLEFLTERNVSERMISSINGLDKSFCFFFKFRSSMKKKFFKLNMIFFNIQRWLIFNWIFITNFIQKAKNPKVSFI